MTKPSAVREVVLEVVECPGGRGHCRRAGRAGTVTLARHARRGHASVLVQICPGFCLSPGGMEQAQGLAELYRLCGWVTAYTLSPCYLSLVLRPAGTRRVPVAAVLDTVAQDIEQLVRCHVIREPKARGAS